MGVLLKSPVHQRSLISENLPRSSTRSNSVLPDAIGARIRGMLSGIVARICSSVQLTERRMDGDQAITGDDAGQQDGHCLAILATAGVDRDERSGPDHLPALRGNAYVGEAGGNGSVFRWAVRGPHSGSAASPGGRQLPPPGARPRVVRVNDPVRLRNLGVRPEVVLPFDRRVEQASRLRRYATQSDTLRSGLKATTWPVWQITILSGALPRRTRGPLPVVPSPGPRVRMPADRHEPHPAEQRRRTLPGGHVAR